MQKQSMKRGHEFEVERSMWEHVERREEGNVVIKIQSQK